MLKGCTLSGIEGSNSFLTLFLFEDQVPEPIRRWQKARDDELAADVNSKKAVCRRAILSELRRIMEEAVRDSETARGNGRHTHGYLSVRIDALRLMTRRTGAELLIKNLGWLPSFRRHRSSTHSTENFLPSTMRALRRRSERLSTDCIQAKVFHRSGSAG